MLKKFGSCILSAGILSTLAIPATAQNISTTPTDSNLVAESKSSASSISEYPNLYSSVPETDLDNLAVTNSLDFANIGQLVDSEDSDLISQRTRTRRTSSRQKYKYSAGLDLINFGWVKDDNGSISSILGFNIGLGVGYRKYFSPAEDGRINFSYTLGTVALVFPFAALGFDYQWESGLFLGADAVTFPVAYFVDDFLFPVLPSLAIGYRW